MSNIPAKPGEGELKACMPWPGVVSVNGYGRIRVDGKWVGIHRIMYEFFRGPIPSGMVIDHLCRNRSCVNPAHLEVVTAEENTLRGVSFSAANAKKSECVRGHPLSGENLRIRTSGRNGRTERECLACKKIRRERSVK